MPRPPEAPMTDDERPSEDPVVIRNWAHVLKLDCEAAIARGENMIEAAKELCDKVKDEDNSLAVKRSLIEEADEMVDDLEEEEKGYPNAEDTIDEYHKVQSTLLPEDQEKVPGDRELVEGLKEVARELIEVECQLGKVANQLMTARHKMALRMTDT